MNGGARARSLLAFVCLALVAAAVPGAAQPTSGTRDILVKNATLWTMSDRGTLESADLLVHDGRIAKVGAALSAPAGALVIDATGKHVTPGLIDAHSHTGIDGGVNEGSNNITSEVRIADVIDADDIAIYRELAGGLTAANQLHGSANSIGGQNQVIKLKWGVTGDALKFPDAPPGIKFALGENPKRSNFGGGQAEPRYPATRMGVAESIRERFIAARQYMKEREAYDRLKPKEQAHHAPPRKDLQLEALVEILQGKRLVHSHCYRQDEILMLIRLADEFGFKIATFQHVLEGYKVADEIAAHGAGGSTFSDWWAYKLEAWDAIPFNGALMTQRGVVVSFNSDSDELARRLNYEAAKAMKYGDLTEIDALKMVTLNPAKQLRIDQRVGSLEPGKDADFVIWSGHPLSTYTIAEQTWVDGTKQFDRADDIAGRAEIERRRAELIEKVKNGDKPKPSESAAAKKDDAGRTTPAAKAAPAASAAPAAPAPPATATGPQRAIPPARPAVYEDRQSPLSGRFAIVGATVHTVSGADIADGTVVIRDGLIAEVGAGVRAPEGATIVDGKGLHLYPGMIDADTVVGLTEIGSVAGSVDITETGKINPNVRAELAINPESELIPVTRAGGITHVLTAPAGGLLSGTSALIRLDGWTWEDLRAAAPVAMHVAYPAYPRTGGFFFGPQVSEEEQKKRRESDLRELKSVFEAARAYRQLKQSSSGSFRADTALEAMIPVIEGVIPVIVEAGEIRAIKEAIAWAKQEGVRMILSGGAESWRVADLLKTEGIPAIVGPILSDSFRRDEPYDTAYTLPLKLHQAGVTFCITNGGGGFAAANTRNLPHQAAMAAAFGLPKDEALKAVTLYPARILGVGDRLGSIETGKSASLILTDGDPLEIRTKVIKEFIDGRPVDLGNKHQRLYDKYRSRPVAARAGH